MSSKKKSYSEKLRDPRWQKRRLKILERDDWTCQVCGDTESTLHVHHRWYERGAEPWEASDDALQTLCEDCHGKEYQLRPQVEQTLLEVLRFAWNLGDVIDLAEAILDVGGPHPPHTLLRRLADHTSGPAPGVEVEEDR